MEYAAWSVERSERSRRRVLSPRAQALINQIQSRMNRHRLLSLPPYLPHYSLPLLLLPPHLTSLHLTSPHFTSPHLTSPHFTSLHLTSPHPPHPPHLTARQVLRCMLSLSFPSFSTYPALFSLCSCCSPPASIASSVLCFIADRRLSPSLDSPLPPPSHLPKYAQPAVCHEPPRLSLVGEGRKSNLCGSHGIRLAFVQVQEHHRVPAKGLDGRGAESGGR
jgi:hypothetical protein